MYRLAQMQNVTAMMITFVKSFILTSHSENLHQQDATQRPRQLLVTKIGKNCQTYSTIREGVLVRIAKLLAAADFFVRTNVNMHVIALNTTRSVKLPRVGAKSAYQECVVAAERKIEKAIRRASLSIYIR